MRIEMLIEDITEAEVDAIVNAANSHLAHAGGVAAAIARAAGPELVAESERADFVPVGGAVATTGGLLPARHVIHAVGPIWSGGEDGEPELLGSAYRSAITVAAGLGCANIAFPSISTGIFGFPVELAAPIAVQTVREGAAAEPAIERVRFCLFSEGDLEVYRAAAAG